MQTNAQTFTWSTQSQSHLTHQISYKTITNGRFPYGREKQQMQTNIFTFLWIRYCDCFDIIGEINWKKKKKISNENWKNEEKTPEFHLMRWNVPIENPKRLDYNTEYQSNIFRHYFQVIRFAEQFTDNDLSIKHTPMTLKF